jgi:ATP-dependent exoDNAse (exonuclease V) alpha subunit
MALYRFEAKVISRAGGRSAVASAAYRTGKCATSAAAYRAGAKLTDERTGQSYDYTKKGGIAGAEIMTPDGAPEWMQDRSKLWNAVEKFEKRKDAQLARDFVISLPHELSHEQRAALTREFVREQFTARGYVADIAWHSPDRADSLNHHAHVMMPMRKVDGESFTRLKERPPDGEHPAAAWRAELARLREAWADTANKHLGAAGLDIRIDHRSLEDRGVDREPEPKQGPLATQIERQGRESLAGNERRAVKARNAERDQLRTEHADVTKQAAVLGAPQPSAESDEKKARVKASDKELDWTDRAGMVAQEESAMKAARDRPPVFPSPDDRGQPQVQSSEKEKSLEEIFSTATIKREAAEEEARRANDPTQSGGRGKGGRTR